MGDLISRQDAIKAIEQLDIPEDMCVFEILSHVELAIGTLPSANQWIPCSERLPESDGDYIVNFHSKFPDNDEYNTVEVAEFSQGAWDDVLYGKVTAWMPLPEPWKGDDDDYEL